MGNRSFFNALCFVILTIVAQVCVSSGASIPVPAAREPPMKASSCPAPELIEPCSCEYDRNPPYTIVIRCSNYMVNQKSVEKVFSELRQTNDIPADRGIEIGWFILSDTYIGQIDLAPFYGSRFSHLNFVLNSEVIKVVTSGNASDYGSIHARSSAILTSRMLTRGGYGDMLRYFSNELSELGATDLALDDNEENTEFLPYLSTHTNLTDLDIGFNIFRRLNSGAFKGLQRLQKISISSGHYEFNYIGENVFNFSPDGTGDDGQNPELELYFGSNFLNESSFHPNSGLVKSGRRTNLRLVYNKITTLPAEVFQPFLEADPQNSIDLLQNPLFCDEKLSWLKARRDEFESQFDSTYCVNDPFTSPFNSDLVP